MRTLTTLVGILIVLAAISMLFYGGYLAAGYTWKHFVELDSTLQLVTLSSFIVFLTGCLIVAGAIRKGISAAKIAGLQDARLGLYKSLIASFRLLAATSNQLSHQSRQEIVERLGELEDDIQLLASDVVIDSLYQLSSALRSNEDKKILSPLMQKIVSNMRKDMGHESVFSDKNFKYFQLRDNAKKDTHPVNESTVYRG